MPVVFFLFLSRLSFLTGMAVVFSADLTTTWAGDRDLDLASLTIVCLVGSCGGATASDTAVVVVDSVPLLLLPWDCCRVKRNAGGASDRVLTDLELQRGNFVSKISVFFHNNVSTSLCCGDKTAQQLQVVFFQKLLPARFRIFAKFEKYRYRYRINLNGKFFFERLT